MLESEDDAADDDDDDDDDLLDEEVDDDVERFLCFFFLSFAFLSFKCLSFFLLDLSFLDRERPLVVPHSRSTASKSDVVTVSCVVSSESMSHTRY